MGRNIPSKSFRMLQSMTGGNDVTDSAQGACNTDAPDECVVFLNVLLQNTLQCLYKFRWLVWLAKPNGMSSSLTFTWLTTFYAIAALAAQPKRRPVRRPEADAPSREQNADDIASMSYVGGNIPSKCFRMLQQSVGEPEASEWLTHYVTRYVTDCASKRHGHSMRTLSCHVFQLLLSVLLALACCWRVATVRKM